MPLNMPTTIALPPFRGFVRRIITIALGAFFVLLLLSRSPLYSTAMGWLALFPDTFLRAPWQLFTYAFLPTGLLSTLFALLSVWFFGSVLEDERGSRWMAEYFFVTTAGGGLLAALLARTHAIGVANGQYVAGLWPFVMALILAYARFHPDQPLRFNFILELKAKYLAAIYLLVYIALSLGSGDRLGPATAVCAALCGWLYIRFVPGRGLGYAASERWFGMRNAFYRSRRQRAARKFTVYMRKQGKDVSLDPTGKYVRLDDERKNPNDKRWMN